MVMDHFHVHNMIFLAFVCAVSFLYLLYFEWCKLCFVFTPHHCRYAEV